MDKRLSARASCARRIVDRRPPYSTQAVCRSEFSPNHRPRLRTVCESSLAYPKRRVGIRLVRSAPIDGCPYQNVDYTIECLTRAASIYRYMESGSLPLPKNWRDRIDRRVRSSELPSQLASDLHEVIQQALDDETTWQPPPWLGSDVFIPVTRYGDLRTVARRFQNCALSRIGSLLTGASCLFVAKTGPDVLIEIARTNVVDGWKIREVQAIDRRAVDPSLLAQFIAEFQAGISLPLDASLDHVAGLK